MCKAPGYWTDLSTESKTGAQYRRELIGDVNLKEKYTSQVQVIYWMVENWRPISQCYESNSILHQPRMVEISERGRET